MAIQLKTNSPHITPAEIEVVRSDPNLVVKEGQVDLAATRSANLKDAFHHAAVDTAFYPLAALGLLRFGQIPEAFAGALSKAKDSHERAGLYADMMARGLSVTYQELISQPLGA